MALAHITLHLYIAKQIMRRCFVGFGKGEGVGSQDINVRKVNEMFVVCQEGNILMFRGVYGAFDFKCVGFGFDVEP